MNETWLQTYILLAFRIHKVVQATYGNDCLFVESYYGPQAWREQAETEQQITPADLVKQATALFDALPAQNFPANREIYLAKHVRAMLMMCRKLCGETFFLEEEANHFLDIQPVWTPEEKFEQAHTLYDSVLPGTGDIAERRRAYTGKIAYPQDQAHMLPQNIALNMVALLKHPIWGRNLLTYASGYRLMHRHLQGPDRIAVFRRLLTEQITPSQLESGTWRPQGSLLP